MGDKLGEEEWVITDVQTRITTQQDTGFASGSRYELIFNAERHLNYYLLQLGGLDQRLAEAPGEPKKR